jgi:hypothetical protein
MSLHGLCPKNGSFLFCNSSSEASLFSGRRHNKNPEGNRPQKGKEELKAKILPHGDNLHNGVSWRSLGKISRGYLEKRIEERIFDIPKESPLSNQQNAG